jgi:hypothetical protein
MRHTEILRVRKQVVAVELALGGMPPRAVEVFLDPQETEQHRRQQLMQLLEHGAPFLPVRDSVTETWEIANRDLIAWIRVPLASLSAAGEEMEELFEIRQKVKVEITHGAPLQGELLYSAEERLTRVTDYLNQQGRFFRLWRDEDLYFVHKSFVTRLIEEN